MTVKEFVKGFDFKNPDWSLRPPGSPLSWPTVGLTSEEIVKLIAMRSSWELREAEKPSSISRNWTAARGYKFLVQWSNLVLLRILVRKFNSELSRSEYRSKNQTNDAARSAVSTLEEGWKRPSVKEYLDFLGFTQGSLEEVKGDVERWLQDGFIRSVRGSSLAGVGIDLKAWNEWARNPLYSSKILSFPLKDGRGGYRTIEELKGNELTYEMFTELVNKTDYLLRKLVQSLEHKQSQEKMRWR